MISFLVGVGSVVGMAWAAIHNNGLLLLLSSTGLYVHPFAVIWAAYRRSRPEGESRRFRFSIRQAMVAAVLAAGYLALLRALIKGMPLHDHLMVLMLAVSMLLMYALFCGLAFATWIRLKDLRAVMRGDREGKPPSRSARPFSESPTQSCPRTVAEETE